MRRGFNHYAGSALLPAVLLSFWMAVPGSSEPPDKPDVLLISLDTLRADHLKCYGYARDTSPHLDRLAREGVLFDNATAASSWTVPSHMSIFTSLYPTAHGVDGAGSALREGVPTLAQVLRDNGYSTAAFVTGPSLNNAFGFNRGFQFYDDFSATLMHETNLFDDLDGNACGINQTPTNHVITNLATTWLRKHDSERFFLFVHYWDCHNDYIPPPPFDKKFDPDYKGKEDGRNVSEREKEIEAHPVPADLAHMVALYDGEIAHTDEHVGKLLTTLEELKLADKTLVIVVSDHGEGFLEHGKLNHGNGLYEELVHVPWIMRLPGTIPVGKRIQGNVSHVDLMPTVLGLLGLPLPPGLQGTDLSPAVAGKADVPDRVIFSELSLDPCHLRAVRWEGYKLVGTIGEPEGTQLFRVTGNDEKSLGAKPDMEVPPDLTQALVAGPSAPGQAAKAAPMSEEDKEALIRRLKSLGYLQ